MQSVDAMKEPIPVDTNEGITPAAEEEVRKETLAEAIASIATVLVVGLFVMTFCGAELCDSLRLHGEDVAGWGPRSGGPDHAGSGDEVGSVCALSRRAAGRRDCVLEAESGDAGYGAW